MFIYYMLYKANFLQEKWNGRFDNIVNFYVKLCCGVAYIKQFILYIQR